MSFHDEEQFHRSYRINGGRKTGDPTGLINWLINSDGWSLGHRVTSRAHPAPHTPPLSHPCTPAPLPPRPPAPPPPRHARPPPAQPTPTPPPPSTPRPPPPSTPPPLHPRPPPPLHEQHPAPCSRSRLIGRASLGVEAAGIVNLRQ